MARVFSRVGLLPVGLSLMLALGGCKGWYQYALPTPVSPSPVPPDDGPMPPGLKAGFGRADITPPPGVGLAGNGPEGRTSTGWRHRLYVRALVLEDARGERIAFVVADLPHVSANLHRLAADRLVGETGIGADRLIVSATHTHSGPGHFYAERQYNDNSARRPGYDPSVADLLVSRIVEAVRQAYRGRMPAKAAWGFQTVRGFTRNRSYYAYCQNRTELPAPCADPAKPTADDLIKAVDPVWALLRVDRLEGKEFRPAGAFSVFAIHGTANPSVTTLLDGDIHAMVERRLEWLIDALNGDDHGFVNRAVHLFANGNEGDVSPNRDTTTTQCPVPRLRAPAYAGPREVAAPWGWAEADRRTLKRCFRAARGFIDTIGRVMGDSAFAHFLRLEDSLRSDLTIARAFTTVLLPGRDGLCPRPAVGTSTVAGASDAPTRLARWKLFGLIRVGFEQGRSARRGKPKGCQERKRILLGSLQQVVTGEHGLPDAAQLTVVRLGNLLIGAVPVEPTTTTGRLFRRAMVEGAGSSGGDSAVIVGLANGFLQYVTTPAEYSEQAYEGGSTLYGPRTQEVLATELRRLGKALPRTARASPPAEVAPITAFPGEPQAIMPRRTTGDTLAAKPALGERWCDGESLIRIKWLDDPPGLLAPAEGQVLEIEERRNGSWVPFAWDDQSDVVVEGLGRKDVKVKGRKREMFEWQVSVARPTAGKTLRLRLLPRSGSRFPGFESDSIPGCPREKGR